MAPNQLRAVALIGVCCFVSACSHGTQQSESTAVADELLPPDELLGVDDVFEVRVLGEVDLSGDFRVADDGSIDYPFAGRISVIGKRSGEIQKVLTEKLSEGYLRNPQVSVMVKEWNSRKVSVLGQVQRPGAVVYFPKMTIVDAIASAGGFTLIAAPNKVTLRRERDGKVKTMTYRVADISEGKQTNIPVMPGDVVVVEERLF